MAAWRPAAIQSCLAPALVLAGVVQVQAQASPTSWPPAPQPEDAAAVRLFNGVNLDGWNTEDVRRGGVTVVDGLLVLARAEQSQPAPGAVPLEGLIDVAAERVHVVELAELAA